MFKMRVTYNIIPMKVFCVCIPGDVVKNCTDVSNIISYDSWSNEGHYFEELWSDVKQFFYNNLLEFVMALTFALILVKD